MGEEIDKVNFSNSDFTSFQYRLDDQLSILKQLIDSDAFSKQPNSIGAELEMYIIDKAGAPLFANEILLQQLNDPQLTPELNRYNLEYNFTPHNISDKPFFSLEEEMLLKLSQLDLQAQQLGGQIVPIGILPTLTPEHVGTHCLTHRKRFYALMSQLAKQRGQPFHIKIDGGNHSESIDLQLPDSTLEGANTSFQVHYRIPLDEYVDTFNAIQLLTPLSIALGANSPTLFGHCLWDETRIPLFKQSIDTRLFDSTYLTQQHLEQQHFHHQHWHQPSRVSFGHGWLRQSPYELFSQAVHLYPPLLPILYEDSTAQPPPLSELCMHQGTVWLWNRPVYSSIDGGHLRIEMRALPSGPTAVDMVANAVLMVGLVEALKPYINELISALPFQAATHNFYRSAQHSLSSTLIWPNLQGSGCKELPIIQILQEYLPLASKGLESAGVSAEESNYYLSIIEDRLRQQQNGALWQKSMIQHIEKTSNRHTALHRMLEHYIDYSRHNIPIAEWSLPS